MDTIGQKLTYYRKKRGLSKKALAAGVCDESTLFRIEKDSHLPNMSLVDQLCRKLSIPMSVLVNEQTNEKQKSILLIKQKCRKHVYDKDFTNLTNELNELKSLLGETEDISHYLDYLFITWHEAIILYRRDNQLEKAKQMLINVLPRHLVLEIEIAMMNSLGLIYVALKENKEALNCFEKAFEAVKDITVLDDSTLIVRVGYNLASRLYYLEDYEQVISIMNKVKAFLETHHLFYMRGRAFHILGKTYEKLGETSLAGEYMKKAVSIFSVEGKDNYLRKAKEDLDEIIYCQRNR